MDDERGAQDALGTFFDDVRTAAAATPAPAAGASLTALFEHGTMPAALAPLPRTRRRQWSLRIAVASAVGGLTLGGLGVAGALPAPVQHRVADVVDVVGVHLPDGRPATTTTTVVPTTTTLTRPTTTVRRTSGGADDRSGTSTTVEDRGHEGDDRRGRDGGSSGSGGDSEGSGSGSGEHRSTTTTVAEDHRDGGSGHSGSGKDGGDSSGSGSDDSSGSASHSSSSHGGDVPILSDRTDSSGSGSGHD